MELVDTLKIEIDKGHLPVSIFMDLSKAFDTIDHTILLKKLKFYGVDGISLELFKSYPRVSHREVFSDLYSFSFTSMTSNFAQDHLLSSVLLMIPLLHYPFAQKILSVNIVTVAQ